MPGKRVSGRTPAGSGDRPADDRLGVFLGEVIGVNGTPDQKGSTAWRCRGLVTMAATALCALAALCALPAFPFAAFAATTAVPTWFDPQATARDQQYPDMEGDLCVWMDGKPDKSDYDIKAARLSAAGGVVSSTLIDVCADTSGANLWQGHPRVSNNFVVWEQSPVNFGEDHDIYGALVSVPARGVRSD